MPASGAVALIWEMSANSLDDWSAQQQVLQGLEAWQTVGEWIDRVDPRFSFRVAERYVLGARVSDAEVERAKKARTAVIARMDSVAGDDAVVCLPTSPTPAPPVGLSLDSQRTLQSRIAPLTCIASTTDRPQVNLPAAEVDGLPVGLSLLGATGSDEMLIAFAQEVAAVGSHTSDPDGKVAIRGGSFPSPR